MGREKAANKTGATTPLAVVRPSVNGAGAERRFREILEQSPFGTSIYAPDGTLILANAAFQALWAVTPEEHALLRGRYNVFADPQMQASGAIDYFRRAFAGDIVNMPVLRYVRDGQAGAGTSSAVARWVEGFLYPILDDAGTVTEVALIMRDVTEQHDMRDQLRQRQRELESLLETNRYLSSVLDLDTLLNLLASSAAALLDTDSCTLFVLAADKPLLKPYLSLGEYSAEMMKESILVGDGITGLCVAERAPILANNAHMDPRATQVDDTPEDEVEHLMAAPLIYRDIVSGALLVSRLSDACYTEDDLKVLAALAGQAAVAIENARLYEQVHQHAAELERRVAERTAELAAANAQLQALSRVKDEFVSNVSHELRTPITNIKLYHSLLGHNPAKRDTYMATLDRETRRLEFIVDDLLSLSRLSQGRDRPPRRPVDLNDMATTYVSDRLPLAERCGLELSLRAHPALPPVHGDAQRLGQVLGILMTNAINYTPSGGRVEVWTALVATENGKWAEIGVSDTGPGIPEAEQALIFDRFYRGSAARASDAPGTGLGLSIAHLIVEQHEGRIRVESDGIPGQGASLTIRLPLPAAGLG